MKKIIIYGDLPHNTTIKLEVPIKSSQNATLSNAQLIKAQTSAPQNVHCVIKKNSTKLYDTSDNTNNVSSQVLNDSDIFTVTLRNDNQNSTEKGHKIEVDYDGGGLDESDCKIFFTPFITI